MRRHTVAYYGPEHRVCAICEPFLLFFSRHLIERTHHLAVNQLVQWFIYDIFFQVDPSAYRTTRSYVPVSSELASKRKENVLIFISVFSFTTRSSHPTCSRLRSGEAMGCQKIFRLPVRRLLTSAIDSGGPIHDFDQASLYIRIVDLAEDLREIIGTIWRSFQRTHPLI